MNDRIPMKPSTSPLKQRMFCVAFTFCPLALALIGSPQMAGAEAAAPTAALVGGSSVGPDYRLTSRDEVVVEVFNQPDIRTAQRLTANGEIRLAMVGRVKLEGLTVREAEMQVEKLFKEGGFLVSPQVIISVNQYSDRSIAVFGQVRSPNRIALRAEANSMGILEAITLVGGFTRIARTDSVQITRTSNEGKEERFVVNVQELLGSRAGDKREFQLLAGDVIFVPERAF